MKLFFRRLYIFLFFAMMAAPVCRAQTGGLHRSFSTPSTLTLDGLHARLETLESRLLKKEIPADPQNLALLRLKIEQAQLQFQSVESNEARYLLQSPYDQTKTEIAAVLSRAESIARTKGDAVYPSSSQMHERAYIAQADGSVQPYWVFVPRDYTPLKKWPLVVFLHGYDPKISKINAWIPGNFIWEKATDRGFILAVPYGRRNSDFVNVGEDDTLAVTDAVSTRYNADPNRTFLMGPSMGGYGVHNVGLHNSERFAAIAPMCAQTDMYLWFNLNRETLPRWKQVLYDVNDPRHLKLNAFQMPIFMQHGNADRIVSVEHSRRFYADLKALKFPAFYNEIPYGSHFIYFEESTFEIAFDWLKELKRAPTPRRVRFSTGALRNNHSHWVELQGFKKYDQMAHIDAEIQDGNIIEVKSENVARFVLKPPAQFLKAETPVTLIVNGVESNQKYRANLPIQWPLEITAANALRKTPLKSGPIRNCYRDPFLLVYGTLKNDGEDEKNARRFLREWDEYADGKPPIKADKNVTFEDKKNFNLVLFGTRESNSLLAAISGKLPLELTTKGYRFGDKEYSGGGKTLGLQFCYASPFNENRMIVVQSGLYWGEELALNHKFDLLPEFIVYDDEIELTDKTNRALTAGFFEDDWSLPTNITNPPVTDAN